MAHYHRVSGFGHEVHSGPPSECPVCHPDRVSRDEAVTEDNRLVCGREERNG